MRLGIVGSRRRNTQEDKELIMKEVKSFLSACGKFQIVSGGCPKGADRFAEEIAKELDLPMVIHKPDKSKLGANTRWAYTQIYHDRNTLIAKDSDVLIACVAPDRKGGTEDTIRKFIKKQERDDINLILI